MTQRFEFFFTPKCASWLNMIEIEFSALARECLHRRIPTQEQLEREVLTLVHEREAKGIKINWQFSIEKARIKLKKPLRRHPRMQDDLVYRLLRDFADRNRYKLSENHPAFIPSPSCLRLTPKPFGQGRGKPLARAFVRRALVLFADALVGQRRIGVGGIGVHDFDFLL